VTLDRSAVREPGARLAPNPLAGGPSRSAEYLQMMTKLNAIVAISSLATVFAAGCGSAAFPLDKLTDAKSTVRAAQEAGAQDTPQAQLHLKMANDELASSQKALDDKDNDRARLLLNQAQADADLSLALARGSADERAARATQAKVVDLSKQAQ
jgi:hypothetical protein